MKNEIAADIIVENIINLMISHFQRIETLFELLSDCAAWKCEFNSGSEFSVNTADLDTEFCPSRLFGLSAA